MSLNDGYTVDWMSLSKVNGESRAINSKVKIESSKALGICLVIKYAPKPTIVALLNVSLNIVFCVS